MTPQTRHRVAWALLLLSPALFAVNMLTARYATFVPPHAMALGRWLFAAIILLPFVWPALRHNRRALMREAPDLLILGALGMWVCGAFVYIGGHTTTALNMGLIYAASPLLVILASRYLYGETLGWGRIAGIALCLAGVATVFAKGRLADLAAVRFTAGDIWLAIAATCWGVYSVLLKHRPSALDPTARLAAIALAGCLVLLPFTLIEALSGQPPALGDWRTWAVWLVLAIVPGVGAYGTFSWCVRELGPSRTSVSLYLGPPYVGAMAWLLLGEAPHWYHGVGALLVLPGIWLATRTAPKEA